MKALFNELKNVCKQYAPDILTFGMWNNQLLDLKESNNYSFALPAVFVEFPNNIDWEQLNNQNQDCELNISFHLIHELYHNAEAMELNLEVFDVRDKVNTAFHMYRPSGHSEMFRTSETHDYDHNNLYHFITSYKMRYNECIASRIPLETIDPPFSLQVNNTFVQEINPDTLLTEQFEYIQDESGQEIQQG